MFLRGRSNNLIREDFATGFMPLDSASAAWGFLTENGRRLLELSLPMQVDYSGRVRLLRSEATVRRIGDR